MISQVDHLGIYVADIDAAVAFWRDVVGLECNGIREIAEGFRIAHVCVGGVELELIEAPIDRTMLRHLPHQAPGLYHVGLRTDDLEGTMRRMAAAGLEPLDPEPRGGPGMRIQFARPDGPSQGVMIEFVQRTAPAPADRAKAREGG